MKTIKKKLTSFLMVNLSLVSVFTFNNPDSIRANTVNQGMILDQQSTNKNYSGQKDNKFSMSQSTDNAPELWDLESYNNLIDVNWDAYDGATEYIVEYSWDSEFSYIKFISTKDTSAAIKNLETGKTYYVRVKAILNNGYETEYSDIHSIEVNPNNYILYDFYPLKNKEKGGKYTSLEGVTAVGEYIYYTALPCETDDKQAVLYRIKDVEDEEEATPEKIKGPNGGKFKCFYHANDLASFSYDNKDVLLVAAGYNGKDKKGKAKKIPNDETLSVIQITNSKEGKVKKYAIKNYIVKCNNKAIDVSGGLEIIKKTKKEITFIFRNGSNMYLARLKYSDMNSKKNNVIKAYEIKGNIKGLKGSAQGLSYHNGEIYLAYSGKGSDKLNSYVYKYQLVVNGNKAEMRPLTTYKIHYKKKGSDFFELETVFFMGEQAYIAANFKANGDGYFPIDFK